MSRKLLVSLAALAALGLAAYTPPAAADEHEPVTGSLVGAGIGAVLGGPPGAAVGAIVGTLVGSSLHEEQHHRRARHVHHSRAYIEPPRRERVAYSERATYAPSPVRYTERASYVPAYNGNGAQCEAERGKAKAVKAAAKPKVKKVCRYVAVR